MWIWARRILPQQIRKTYIRKRRNKSKRTRGIYYINNCGKDLRGVPIQIHTEPESCNSKRWTVAETPLNALLFHSCSSIISNLFFCDVHIFYFFVQLKSIGKRIWHSMYEVGSSDQSKWWGWDEEHKRRRAMEAKRTETKGKKKTHKFSKFNSNITVKWVTWILHQLWMYPMPFCFKHE